MTSWVLRSTRARLVHAANSTGSPSGGGVIPTAATSRGRSVSAVDLALRGEERRQRFPLGALRLAGQCEGKGRVESRVVVAATGSEHAHGERARGLNKRGIVEQRERLLRRVAHVAGCGAFVARGRIEVGQHRMQKRALPMRVDATAPLAVAVAGDVVAVRELQCNVVARRLVRLGARAAEIAQVEQAGNRESVIAHELGFESAGIL